MVDIIQIEHGFKVMSYRQHLTQELVDDMRPLSEINDAIIEEDCVMVESTVKTDRASADQAIALLEKTIAGLRDGTYLLEGTEVTQHIIEVTGPDSKAEEWAATGREVVRIEYVRSGSPTFQIRPD